MAIYNTYTDILQFYDDTGKERHASAIEYAQGAVFEECEPQSIGYAKHIDTINGIEIYYDYAADYYFFCPEESIDLNVSINAQQEKALFNKWQRDNNGMEWTEFLQSVVPGMDCIMVKWCNIWLGIETDGHCHS